MAEALFLRRLLRPRAAATAAVFLKQNYFSVAASAAVKKENGKFTEKNEEKKEGKWVILPPFTTTVNGSSLGRKISRGGRIVEEEKKSIETTPSALKWVLRCCPHLPRSLVHKLFRLRQVRRECLDEEGVNNGAKDQEFRLKRVGEKDMMNQGERIFLPLSVQESPVKKPGYHCNDQDKHFTRSLVMYKDSAIIVINKPPKLPVQGGIGIKRSVDELAGSYLRYDNEDPPRLVHRLDQDSSGILVMGRTRTTATVLHSIFREKTVGGLDYIEIDWKKRVLHKRYLALVLGVPNQLSGMVSAPLAKVVVDDGKSERITVDDSRSPSSQHAMTEYKVIQTSKYGYTWLELAPITGRKHQLRVHCAEVLGTPIVGDYKYGWQAHKKWKPMSFKNPSDSSELGETKSNTLGRDLDCGSIAEKQPHLHLHCKQLILPNISTALENVSSDCEYDFSKLENLNFVAPLPSHMQRSWNLLNSLAHHQGY
ncbi:RNA pseudouridine synthase 4, mitochondrial [Silene latifolia]|uniref:RNA pseudouridine synthase 4, mitochondrial n=1 Tax=Silene latifolia TaxID=37657 RepID=UPI003D76AA1B